MRVTAKLVRQFALMSTVIAAMISATSVGSFAASPEIEKAEQLFKRGDYEASLSVLDKLNSTDGEAWYLKGKNHYQQGDFKKASDALEQAVKADPGNSMYRLWLGKAYGRRAETANFISAAGLAGKTRDNFEKAVELDPANLEAHSDAMEYYLEAPGFMGGGMDKAKATAAKIAALNPAEGEYALARIAEKEKDKAAVEKHLRRAIELAPKQVGRHLDLAKFLSKQGRYEESDKLFAQAQALAPKSPKVLYAKAEALIRAGRDQEVARELLNRYLLAQITPDDPSKAEARNLLKKLDKS